MAQNMALDLMLRTLMGSPEFRDAQNKNWDAVARLIPGSTSQQCAKRWKEIQQTFSVPSTIYSKSHSLAGAKNLSQFVNSFLYSAEEKGVTVTGAQVVKAELQPEVNSSEGQLPFGPGPDRASKAVSYQDSSHSKQRSALRQVSRSARSQISTGESSQGPNMVIHVCDEGKNLKQDFTCPRDLLISEMRYFAEYLSVEAQRWEEVDISVHCDVQIFDWLMRYVKRKLHDKNKSTLNEKRPKLEPNNVISILISSDFLKMDSLVGECIQFCHENMSTIVATPCNMNCINDKLVTRIAQLFNHNELDDIRDRKDKFKSKLFCKKIEELFDPRTASSRSPSNASTLFRCVACGKLLTAKSQSKLRCVPNRMMVNHRGKVSYVHTRDFTWDVNDYLLGLRDELKSWKDVYWRLWGAVNILYCYRCGHCFPCSELGHCSYHPMVVDYGKQDCTGTKVVGVYPCCQQRVLHFDPSSEGSGCCVRDHRTTLVTPHSAASESKSDTKDSTSENTAEKSSEGLTSEEDKPEEKTAREETGNVSKEGRIQVSDSVADEGQQTNGAAAEPPSPSPKRNSVLQGNSNIVNNPVVIEDLFAHRTSICVPFRRLTSARSAELNVFGVEELALASMRARETESDASALSDMIDPSERKPTEYPMYLPSIRRSRSRLMHRTSVRRMKLQTGASKEDDYDLGEDEDQPESEDNDIDFRGPSRERPRPPRKVTSASRKDFSTFKSYKWNTQRSARWNQDAQREEDQKRMTELVSYLTRKRSNTPQEKSENKQKAKEFAGGIFSKLEYRFRMSQQPPTSKTQSGAPQTGSSQRIRKIPLKVTT